MLAKVTVDTTGDGDVAAFAGAKFVFGPTQEHYPMWCYLGQFLQPTVCKLDFQNSVDTTNVDDYTRAILVGRRLGPKCHDHGAYLTTRESRHIVGDATVTFTDILHQRQFPDAINIGAGTMDIHGKVTTDWLRMGLISPIIATEMPYGALLPQGLDNLLVAAKAYSGKHDTLFNLRNQPDMENLGGAVGVAAAYAAQDGVTARKLDLAKLQKRLTRIGTLPPDVLTRRTEETPYDAAAIRAFLNLLDGRPLQSWETALLAREGTPEFRKKIPIVEICTASPEVAVPVLQEALATATGDRRVRIAQALAMFGSASGAPVLIEAIDRELASGELPPRPGEDAPKIQWSCAPIAPADLVYCLGMCRDPRAIPTWKKVAGWRLCVRNPSKSS